MLNFLLADILNVLISFCSFLIFLHMSKNSIFIAIDAFTKQKRGFLAFWEVGNPTVFYDFWPFLAVFALKQHNSLNMHNMDAKNWSTHTRHSVKGTYLPQLEHDCATGKNCTPYMYGLHHSVIFYDLDEWHFQRLFIKPIVRYIVLHQPKRNFWIHRL